MIQKINNVSFKGGVKYSKAGLEYFCSLPQTSRKTLVETEIKMKSNRYANLIVNKDGYKVQTKDNTGIHCYKIFDVLFSAFNDVKYHTKTADGTEKVFSFNFAKDKKAFEQSARYAADDATYKTNHLLSSIFLTKLLEKNSKYPIKKSFF